MANMSLCPFLHISPVATWHKSMVARASAATRTISGTEDETDMLGCYSREIHRAWVPGGDGTAMPALGYLPINLLHVREN